MTNVSQHINNEMTKYIRGDMAGVESGGVESGGAGWGGKGDAYEMCVCLCVCV